MNNEQIIFNKYPDGMPQDDTFKYEEIDITNPQNGEIQLKTLYISVDPYMRGRMSQGDSYVQPFEVGKPIVSHIVAQVTASEADGFQEGDIVTGMLPWKNIIQ